MRNYGMVKGRAYRNTQPEPPTRKGKRLCPKCKRWRPENEFVDRDNLPKKFCKQCRLNMTKERWR